VLNHSTCACNVMHLYVNHTTLVSVIILGICGERLFGVNSSALGQQVPLFSERSCVAGCGQFDIVTYPYLYRERRVVIYIKPARHTIEGSEGEEATEGSEREERQRREVREERE
jgi:hypothetical protein